MRTIFLLLFTLSSFAQEVTTIQPREYNFSESAALSLAKEMCSCLFVSEQQESYCKKITKESRIFANYKIKSKKKQVHTTWGGYRSEAHFNTKKPQFGCKIVIAERFNRIDKVWHDIADEAYWDAYLRKYLRGAVNPRDRRSRRLR
ncbi:hypothetical protein OAT67_07020 [Bacteriovoracaceae bacterium]|nr:hypothetical protein [Bacteriovoracaceae bacterium]